MISSSLALNLCSNDFFLVIFSVRLFLDTLSTISSHFNILPKIFLYPFYPYILLFSKKVSHSLILFINIFFC